MKTFFSPRWRWTILCFSIFFSCETPQVPNCENVPFNSPLVYARLIGENRQIFVSVGDGNESQLTDTGDNLDPAWSPDGQTIAFVSNRASLPGNRDLFLMNADGSDQREVGLPAFVLPRRPRWSSDGTKIVFHTAVFEIYILELDGLNFHKIPINIPAEDPYFSQDATEVVFTGQENENWDLRIVDLLGTNLRQLTQSLEQASTPIWSADGQTVLFFQKKRATNSGTDIMKLDIATGTITEIITGNGRFFAEPHWYGTSGEITIEELGTNQLWLTDINGNTPRLVCQGVPSLADYLP